MIASTTRRRLLQSSTTTSTAVRNAIRFDRKCGRPPQSFFLLRALCSASNGNESTTAITRFEDRNLHPSTLEALRKQGIFDQTEIQQKTHDLILDGHNVVARSRTGTGKTLAFLVPCLERYLKVHHQQHIHESTASEELASTTPSTLGIPILVLAPTRELAAQIGGEAEKLLAAHPSLSSQVVHGGGTSKAEDERRFGETLPTVLVATPGRLKDHLATTFLKVPHSDSDSDSGKSHRTIPFRAMLQNGNLRTLILDETDRLLELGFRKDVQNILSYLDDDSSSFFGWSPQEVALPRAPPQKRQTLLFSATLSGDVLGVANLALATKPSAAAPPPETNSNRTGESVAKTTLNYKLVDCVAEEDPSTHTNTNTKQTFVVLPPERFWTGTIEFILQLMAGTTSKQGSASSKKNTKPKIVVFFELTRLAQLFAKFLSLRMGCTLGVWELHGKMHQRERTLVTRRFRSAPSGVLLTSDVSARGVDYPDVTHVVQVGAPHNRETYIHRLGRTGRAGKDGTGILVLPEHEHDFLRNELGGLGLVSDDDLQRRLVSKRISSKQKSPLGNIRRDLENELGMLQHDLRSGNDSNGMEECLILAYQSLVSYYFQTRRKRRNRHNNNNNSTSKETEDFWAPSDDIATVAILNQLAEDFGLSELPPIGFKRAKSMGIEHLQGQLNIRKGWEDQHHQDTFNSIDGDRVDVNDWFGLPGTSQGAGDPNPAPKQRAFRDNKDMNRK